MAREAYYGWDLGGAHLKIARLDQKGVVEFVRQAACPLWQGMRRFHEAVATVLAETNGIGGLHAVTMTGELADLFLSRRSGVQRLIAALSEHIAADTMMIYAGPAGFVLPDQAYRETRSVASANWLATASYLASVLEQGVLIDIGSTTTDIVPFAAGSVRCVEYDDHGRLRAEELVYSGVVRTAVNTITERVPFAGGWVPLMGEQFATAADVYRITDELPAHADMIPTADGAAKDSVDCMRRLARMLGCDLESAEIDAWREVAVYLRECQLRRIADACARTLSRRVVDERAPLVGAGVGRFLVKRIAQRTGRDYVDFGSLFMGDSDAAADCAPAVAVACLARTIGVEE